MRLVVVLSVLLGLLRVPTLSKADEGVYFEASGDSNFPTDDEDNWEGSGTEFSFEDEEEEPTIDVIDKVDEVEDGDHKIRVKPTDDVSETPEVEKDDDLDNEKAEQEGDVKSAPGAFGMGPHFLAAVVVGGCIGLLFAVCVIMLLVYRMRKKDEGSYALEYGLDGKKPQGGYEYTKGVDSKEYYA